MYYSHIIYSLLSDYGHYLLFQMSLSKFITYIQLKYPFSLLLMNTDFELKNWKNERKYIMGTNVWKCDKNSNNGCHSQTDVIHLSDSIEGTEEINK